MSSLADVLAAGDGLSVDRIDALGHDEFEAAFRRFLAAKQAMAVIELRFLDAARRRRIHERHGFRDTGAWVASIAGERAGTARRDVALAEQVAATPVVAAALDAGAVSKVQAGVLLAAAALPVEAQERLVERADVLSVERLGQAVREAQFNHGVVPADPLPSVELTPAEAGGRVEGRLDAEAYELVHRALYAAVDHMGLPTDLPIGHRRALALAGIARFYLEHAEGAPTDRVGVNHTLALVPIETLLATTGGSAALSSGAVISGDTARRLACDAGITRTITKGRSEILDVGRSTRTISPALAKAVIARDRQCTHHGCHAPPWLCEIHHVLHWALGGSTSLENLRLLCWYHHQLEHETTAHRRRTEAA